MCGASYIDCAEAAGRSAERVTDFFRVRGPDVERAGGILQLGFVQLVIAAHKHERQPLIEHIDKCFDLPVGCRAARKGRQVVNRAHAGGWKLFRFL